MSVVLVGPSGSRGRAVLERLSGQGDDIRVIDDDAAAADRWKVMGAHVALAREWDADLIERASYEARTIVIFEGKIRNPNDLLEEVLRAAKPAGVTRVILLRPKAMVPEALALADIDYVVLGTGGGGVLRRSTKADDDLVATAVDAADDLPGNPRLDVDLTDRSELKKLGLS